MSGEPLPRPAMDRTINAAIRTPERLGDRPRIAHDTPINGREYVGAGARERIVVDDHREKGDKPHRTKVYDEVYNEFLAQFKQQDTLKGKSPRKAARLAMEVVAKRLTPVDPQTGKSMTGKALEDYVMLLINAATGGRPYEDVKVNLADFISFGAGVCRHRALLAGYLLERMAKDGLLKGAHVSIDRNKNGQSAHAWARFTYGNFFKRVMIIDPMHGYVGSLKDAVKNSVKMNGPMWDYRRPTDQ